MSDKRKERIKREFKNFLSLDVEYANDSRTCFECGEDLSSLKGVIECERRTQEIRYVYQFCSRECRERGWPPREELSEGRR